MKARIPVLLVLCMFTALGSVSCGGGDNPAAPEAKAPTAATTVGEGSVGASGAGDINTATAIQSWAIQDACSDGRGIQARLWEASGLRLTGRYTRVLKTRGSLGTLRFRLLCLRGMGSCMGATTNPASSTVWGVGLNAERRPAKAFCKACASNSISMRLICTRRADGSTDAQLVESLDDALADGVSDSSVSDEGLATFEIE